MKSISFVFQIFDDQAFDIDLKLSAKCQAGEDKTLLSFCHLLIFLWQLMSELSLSPSLHRENKTSIQYEMDFRVTNTSQQLTTLLVPFRAQNGPLQQSNQNPFSHKED